MVRARRRPSVTWMPFSSNITGGESILQNKNFYRMVMLAILLGVYFVLRSWWTYIPVRSLKQREFFDSQGVRRIKVLDPSSEARFMDSILPKPPKLPEKGVKVLDSVVASKLKAAQPLRYIQGESFTYCDILDGAVLDSLAHLDNLSGPLGSKNPRKDELAKLVDETARKIFNDVLVYFSDADPVEAKRYACFSALDGANPNANLSKTPLSTAINPKNYFLPMIPNITPNPSKIEGKRRKYKLAYLVLIQELHGFHQIKKFLEIVDDSQAVFLLHVPKTDDSVYALLDEYIKTDGPRDQNGQSNVFLSTYRYGKTTGHIDIVYSQLSGFWELLDMADWDYVINLSNYDWPLRHNQQIHSILQKHPGHSYIEFNTETSSWMAQRLRPYLVDKSASYNSHLSELGIGRWHMPYWTLYSQSQWMILTRSAVEFLRNDPDSFNLLSALEYTYNPEEKFFATALANSPVQRDFLIQDKKRYSRDASSGQWLGWKDKDLFPPGSSDPSYLFFRPFNALGDFFGEEKLKAWVKENHLDRSLLSACYPDELGLRDECIREIATTYSVGNQLVVVPIGFDEIKEAATNLKCSLLHLGIENVLYWALDSDTHKSLISNGYLSYFNPALLKPGEILKSMNQKDAISTKVLREKVRLLHKVLSAGFDLWYLDPDVVASRSFIERASEYTKAPLNAEIVLSVGDPDVGESTIDVKSPPKPNLGIMYMRNTENSLRFLESVMEKLKEDAFIDGNEAITEFISHSKQVSWTGIGSIARTIDYPEAGKEKTLKPPPSKNDAVPNRIASSWVDFFNVYSEQDAAAEKIRVHYFDQLEYVDGHHEIPQSNLASLRLIKGKSGPDLKSTFDQNKLWYVDDKGECIQKWDKIGIKAESPLNIAI